MQREATFWLTAINILCGLLVFLALLYVASGPVWERLAKIRARRLYRAELDHDMLEMFGGSRGTLSRERAPDVRPRRWRVWSFLTKRRN